MHRGPVRQRPMVTISYAQSLDGRIATLTGDSQWISGSGTLQLSQELRRDNDAILVGIGTVLRDDPLLTCRLPGCPSPLRVILDSRLRLPVESRIARTAREHPVLVLTAAGGKARQSELESCGVAVHRPGGLNDRVDVVEASAYLYSRGVRTLYVEGGSGVITAFLGARIVDRLIVVTAPIIIGEGITSVGDIGVRTLDQALRLRGRRLYQSGADVVWELTLDE